jgi:hypothetical protein
MNSTEFSEDVEKGKKECSLIFLNRSHIHIVKNILKVMKVSSHFLSPSPLYPYTCYKNPELFFKCTKRLLVLSLCHSSPNMHFDLGTRFYCIAAV